MTITRRDLLGRHRGRRGPDAFRQPASSGGPPSRRREPSYKPEEGATLRLLRWSPFVKADEERLARQHEEVHRRDGRRR